MRGFGQPLLHLTLTAGDWLARPDLTQLIAAAREQGFPCLDPAERDRCADA